MSRFPSSNLSSIITTIVVILFLSVVGFVVFQGFFQLGICCDEITLIVTAKTTTSLQSFYDLFTGPYGSQYLFMYILYRVFAFHYTYYYITSIVLRLLAVISLYFLTIKISKSIFVALFTALLCLVSLAGLETTEGVNNSTTYLAIPFFNLGFLLLYNYFTSISSKIYTRTFLLAIISFFFAFTLAPIRMHGLVFIYLFIEIGLLIIKRSQMKATAARLMLFFGMLFLISQIGFFRAEGTARFITESPVFAILHLILGFQKAIVFMIINSFQIIFPEQTQITNTSFLTNFLSGLLINKNHFHILYMILLESVLTLIFILKNNKKSYLVTYLVVFLGELLLLLLLQNALFRGWINNSQLVVAVQSIFLLFLSLKIIIAILNRDQKKGFILLILLLFPFTFFLTYYAIDPNTYIDVTSRYMFISAEGFYLYVVFLLYSIAEILFTHNKPRFLIVNSVIGVFFVMVIAANIYESKQFIALREGFRSNKQMQLAFNVMNKEISETKSTAPLVLLTTDSPKENGDFMYWSIVYGGNARFALQGDHNQSPTFVSSLTELKKDVEANNLSANDVFSFMIKHKTVYPNTKSTRALLQNK